MSVTIASLHFYPIKSCGSIAMQSAYAGPRGFEYRGVRDRSWMLIDESGVMISQRDHPELARIIPEILSHDGETARVKVTTEGLAPLYLNASEIGAVERVVLFKKETTGHLASAEAALWFSKYLHRQVRLVYQSENDRRFCDPAFAANPNVDETSFSDGYAYLIAGQGTLARLNDTLVAPVPMNRFRANIVIGGIPPEAEYGWKKIAIGETIFDLVKPCARCVITTVDQQTGERQGKEPLATLARSSLLDQGEDDTRIKGAIFGENAHASRCGQVTIGEAVTILEEKPAYNFVK